MKYFSLTVSFIVTIIFLYIAKDNAMNNSKFYTAHHNNMSIEYNSTPKVFEDESFTISIDVLGQLENTSQVNIKFLKLNSNNITDFSQYDTFVMERDKTIPDRYNYAGTADKRGLKTFYFFDVVDSSGNSIISLIEKTNLPFTLKYIGHVPTFILIGHILFIFLSIFFIVLATVDTVNYLRGAEELSLVAKHTLWAVIFCFIGGYPFGFAMNWYAFNGLWEGVPFGTDATDNKTQLLFVYILFAVISMKGSLQNKPSLNLYREKTIPIIAIGSFCVMTFVNLIPHSIQFSKSFTELFCYSFIAIVFILTLIPFIKQKTGLKK